MIKRIIDSPDYYYFYFMIYNTYNHSYKGRRGRYHMSNGYTTIYATSVYRL